MSSQHAHYSTLPLWYTRINTQPPSIDADIRASFFAGPFLGNLIACHAQATVGAGLPVISTLQTLLSTGDTVLRIEGVLSGTLSYIFNSFGPGCPFSEVVAAAATAGYTEPDPRDDLSGGACLGSGCSF